MSNPLVDMIIPTAPKDYSKLPHVVAAIRKFISVKAIHVITPNPDMLDCNDLAITIHSDSEILPYDRSLIRYRPNWMFQKLLKYFQDVTEHDWFLVMDADIFVQQPIPLWNEKGQPIFNLGRDQYHLPYFEFNKEVLGFDKNYPHSFISECILYNKVLLSDMLEYCKLTRDGLWDKIVEFTCKVMDDANYGRYMSEGEFYGSYITHERPDIYEMRHLNTVLNGWYGDSVWTDKEIQIRIENARSNNPDAHLISLHSWS